MLSQSLLRYLDANSFRIKENTKKIERDMEMIFL